MANAAILELAIIEKSITLLFAGKLVFEPSHSQ
jgi:hypothetical protein